MPFAFDPLNPSTSTDAGALATEAQSADGSSSTAFVSNSSCAACGKSNAGDDILKMCVACKAVKCKCGCDYWSPEMSREMLNVDEDVVLILTNILSLLLPHHNHIIPT